MERNAVYGVGSMILAHQLAGRDPAAIDQSYLALMADLSVRAALELDAAIERAERAVDETGAAEQPHPPAREPVKPPTQAAQPKPTPETKAGDATA